MALTSEATTIWIGTLFDGSGDVILDSSELADFHVTWDGRSEGVANMTNPEELLAAAHSSCFSMALSLALAQAGHPAESMQITAAVTFQPGKGVHGQPPAREREGAGHHRRRFEAFAARREGELPDLEGALASRSRSKPNSPDP